MGTFLSSLVASCCVLAGFSGHLGADPRSHMSQQQQSCCVQKDRLHCLPSWVSSGQSYGRGMVEILIAHSRNSKFYMCNLSGISFKTVMVSRRCCSQVVTTFDVIDGY